MYEYNVKLPMLSCLVRSRCHFMPYMVVRSPSSPAERRKFVRPVEIRHRQCLVLFSLSSSSHRRIDFNNKNQTRFSCLSA